MKGEILRRGSPSGPKHHTRCPATHTGHRKLRFPIMRALGADDRGQTKGRLRLNERGPAGEPKNPQDWRDGSPGVGPTRRRGRIYGRGPWRGKLEKRTFADPRKQPNTRPLSSRGRRRMDRAGKGTRCSKNCATDICRRTVHTETSRVQQACQPAHAGIAVGVCPPLAAAPNSRTRGMHLPSDMRSVAPLPTSHARRQRPPDHLPPTTTRHHRGSGPPATLGEAATLRGGSTSDRPLDRHLDRTQIDLGAEITAGESIPENLARRCQQIRL